VLTPASVLISPATRKFISGSVVAVLMPCGIRESLGGLCGLEAYTKPCPTKPNPSTRKRPCELRS
jgi:hypothetical protein